MSVQDIEKSLAERMLSNGELFEEFMPITQRFALKQSLHGEEGDAVAKVVLRIAEIIRFMPKSCETDRSGTDELAHLHYFRAGVDAWITEKDAGGPHPDEIRQVRAFGRLALSSCRIDPGVRCISIRKLIENNVELDLFWEAKPVKHCA